MIRSALTRGRLLACSLLAAVPREEATSSLEREREARGWERDELRRQLDQCQGDLQLMRAAAQVEANKRNANERRLEHELQRLETALTTEQGLRAQAERAAIEVVGLRAEVDKRQRCEEDLRERQHRALTELRSQTDTNYRLLAIPARALCGALDGGDLPSVAKTALGNLRRALGMVE